VTDFFVVTKFDAGVSAFKFFGVVMKVDDFSNSAEEGNCFEKNDTTTRYIFEHKCLPPSFVYCFSNLNAMYGWG
jgi:hypothetical protein